MVRFLRLAGYRRQAKSGNDQEDDAIERILVLVYGGDQSAVDVCMKLANGSDEKIDDFDVTCTVLRFLDYFTPPHFLFSLTKDFC